ncbi:vesicle transport through interaction with t-SNAREs homolog 1B-like [Nylanderia fulva]|uniref:vesicle transport through interaction with t-SNAREs homolog 1B-like n=1 Tax=Nylanderia fulva TaxID=613905 RepID=UPI0010FB8A62|nr:vesicle transport through interaction with t-SNAREs homolog 1B-like [Nylanderia fulva]XP_029172764.1 vesicle transport through interaction with t-SNAREs homolog 1B-like [Nylanderia fulva]
MNFGTVDWEAEHRRVLLDGNAALARSSQSVARSQAIAAENEQIGTEVVSELGEQRDRLLRAKHRLSQTDEELNKARKILLVMRVKVLTNKIVLVLIILLELVILGIIVYLKFFHK